VTNIHALIIDDNITGVKVLAGLLETVQASYTSVQDPTKVVDLFDGETQFDVIFLDLEMPKLDGYKVLQLLRDELNVTAPVIAYSVHTSEVSTVRELGFDGFLGKPLNRMQFADQLQRILDGERVWEVE
jgi:two-component system, cell cycle response regulator DivK